MRNTGNKTQFSHDSQRFLKGSQGAKVMGCGLKRRGSDELGLASASTSTLHGLKHCPLPGRVRVAILRAAVVVIVVHREAVDLGDTEERRVRRRCVLRTAPADPIEVVSPTSAPCDLTSHSLYRI